MRRAVLLAGAALALCSTLALAAPESLLPPSFDNPAPTPAPRPAPTPSPAPAQNAPAAPPVSEPVIQPLPGITDPGAIALPDIPLPANFPSLAELEAMDPDQIDELLGLKPKFDIPPAARRALREVGVIGQDEGGFDSTSLAAQPPALVQAALQATRGPLVSRWGHILLRRALASRLDAPQGMDPASFIALRASLLNRIGEGLAARALVQDVDSSNYNAALASAAFDAYLATGDLLGICPVARLKGTLIEDAEWDMARAICAAYAGEARQAERDLQRMLYYGEAPRIDALLAQRFAGAAGEGRRAVNIEWNNVDELTPWRFGLSRQLGVELPAGLRNGAGPTYDISDVLIPAVPLPERVAVMDVAGERGILSSAAMVDLYSQLWSEQLEGEARTRASTLREAYVASDPADRLAAMQQLWGDGTSYGRWVLTAYAAARLPVSEPLVDDAPRIIGSMLAAGLDRNAMRWGSAVAEGSEGWALLAVGQPGGTGQVGRGAVSQFIDDDSSENQRKSRFLVAGLAGLGRLDFSTAVSLGNDLGVNLNRESPWSRKIDRAGELRNQTLVALLAGLGMQGSGWDKMTARHLYHIVRALDQAGLNAEARMIAAEAVARG
ncbi:hypothetical protein KK137_06600 [Croceibacterium sp. LX-88]|uniref:Lytic transglycosylase n=1 Tax=Croceibacterium selenioxidans TaxID=2838833 RepID=A0ABS5W2W1_9SPHN|nr:hypothetical protein [Croceibacterium selenioxidans]MBT2133999.1 hypothetical protein [Croceibacterium selenioxidans]